MSIIIAETTSFPFAGCFLCLCAYAPHQIADDDGASFACGEQGTGQMFRAAPAYESKRVPDHDLVAGDHGPPDTRFDLFDNPHAADVCAGQKERVEIPVRQRVRFLAPESRRR